MNVLINVLEYVAFGSALLTAYLYGVTKFKGAVSGIITSTSFILWGILANSFPAWSTNIIFLSIHIWNLKKAINENIGMRR